MHRSIAAWLTEHPLRAAIASAICGILSQLLPPFIVFAAAIPVLVTLQYGGRLGLGVAVVGTAVGYVHDWSPDRAVSVPVGDAEALARAMLDLMRDSGRRRALGMAAQAWAVAHDADWTAARFTELYREVSGEGTVP